MTNYGHIRHSISNSDQFSTGAPEKATHGLWRHLVADTACYGIYCSRMTCCRLWWPTVVKNIKFERVSHVKSELRYLGLPYQVMECKALWDKMGRVWSNVAYSGAVFLIVSRYDRLGPYFNLYYPFRAVWHFLWGLIILRSKCHVSSKVARNGP